ncbi:MAG: hypothetical protein A2Z07_10520 [Armatimonadetes bacterium RBG_16_67_12]|nr:MAG: hypothetical protein A2Z07_10520 [Armatimonadetes bacterium RBG_16_67_12]
MITVATKIRIFATSQWRVSLAKLMITPLGQPPHPGMHAADRTLGDTTMRLVRQITTVGNSIGVTLPREFLDAYGLEKGSLVEVRAIGMGLLLRPLRLPSTHAPPRKTLWNRGRRPPGRRRGG